MTQSKAASHTPAWQNLERSLQTPLVWFTGLLLLIYVGLEASLSNWAYIVQVSDRQIPTLVAGYSISAYWVGLTVGRFILGYFLRSLGAVKTMRMSLVLLTIGLLAWWQLPDQWLSLPMIGFALAPIFPTTIWLIPKQLPASLVPAAVSFATSAASVGAAMIPSGVGWIASWSGLGIIPLLMLPLAIAMIVLHWSNSRHQNCLGN